MLEFGIAPNTTPLWFSSGLVLVWLGVVLAAAEGLYRYRHLNPEFSRKIVHIGTGNVILIAWGLGIPAWIGIAAAILAGLAALLSYWLPLLPGVNSVGRQSLGTFFYAVSIGVLIAGFWESAPYYTVLGILIMTWGDGCAALVGMQFGQHPYRVLGMNKSLEGTAAMFIISYLISQFVLLASGTPWTELVFVSLLVAATATLLESFSTFGLDNLTVPVGSATLAFYIQSFWVS
ncbi:phosphatidate cytidylyltransferase [Geitlerinema sp. P-1104]|uniref:diacylglycerol/polyprenol kinase family protein n=1 Tax=Geitlerinema sp. P-1104 TaxID=2546230 RepID=UPI00147696FE|nr:diacylglycerol/polyprenol kinase family protein [Geitlerinema sp. P-1104]NMG59165.1 phosphatidate cytidylyltransferase [Geitlerinema sp. P-1104]